MYAESPDRRYSDMEELISDLKESLVNPEGDFVKIAPLDSRAHTVIVSQDELNKIKEGRNEMHGRRALSCKSRTGQYRHAKSLRTYRIWEIRRICRAEDKQYANNGYQNPQNYAGGYYQPEEPQEPEVNRNWRNS